MSAYLLMVFIYLIFYIHIKMRLSYFNMKMINILPYIKRITFNKAKCATKGLNISLPNLFIFIK